MLEQAQQRDDAEFELVDLADYPLPHLDEPLPASAQRYQNEHTKAWSAKISEFDGFVFVTPEYNHATSGVLKNALDYLNKEWHNKAAAFVGYGVVGGARAVENLRLVTAELQIAGVRQGLYFSVVTDFENFSTFKPGAHQLPYAETMFDQLVAWAQALEPLRAPLAVAA